MKKILLSLLIIFIVYIILIFKLPVFALKIWEFLWIKKFNEFVEKFWSWFNNVVTDIPTSWEVLDVYNKTLSWANIVKWKLLDQAEKTKSVVDEVRINFSWSEEKIKDIKTTISTISNTIDETKDSINDTIDNVWQIKWKIETINEILTKTWELN